MWYKGFAVAGLMVACSAAQGQQVKEQGFAAKRTRLELRPFAGKYLPHGDQRRDFHSAPASGMQAAMGFGSALRVVASASWTDGRSRLAAVTGLATTRLWQYDVGAEFNTVQVLSPKLRLLPFFGLGAGARNYYYPKKGISNVGYPAGYYSIGAELRRGFMGLRAESRSYLSAFRAPLDPAMHFRDDGFVTLGLVYHQ